MTPAPTAPGGAAKTTADTPTERAAAAIANARIMRRGSPPIANVMGMLPAKLKDEVREDAEEALKAVGFDDLLTAAKEAIRNNWLSSSMLVACGSVRRGECSETDRSLAKVYGLLAAAIAKAEGQAVRP